MATEVSAVALRARLTGRAEIALVDVREEGAFSKSHIFLGSCLPASHLEFRAARLMPRKSVPVIVTDGGPDDDGLAHRSAKRLGEIGYSDVSVLAGGVAGWAAQGYEVFSGVNVPSKAFGEFVEHHYDTPRIAAQDLMALTKAGEDIVILDSRPMDEFHRMSIPGGVDCPGAELVYRVGMMAPDPATTIIVNCAGRTRSIIGAQSLINAGIPNRVMALKDGTMGWELAGLQCARGLSDHAPEPVGDALDKARERVPHVAKRFGVAHTSVEQLQAWRADTARTTFLLDVRSAEEFSRAHWAGAQHAAGGQLVQATDEYVGVRNARIVLCDSPDGVRATMTASWLVQLGYRDVYVLVDSPEVPETGEDVREPALFVPFPTITVAKLRELLKGEADTTAVIDLASSPRFRRGHIPGAHWAVRARLAAWGPGLPVGGHIVLTSPDGLLAHYVAHELSTVRPDVEVQVLDGGTSGWVAAGEELESGLKRVLTETDDVWWKPYESQGGVKQAMEDYLTWEVGLVEQIERDRLVTFRAFD